MQIKRIDIDINFPLDLIKQIEEFNSKLEFSPIWQSIKWNLMLQATGYISRGFFVGCFEGNMLINFAIVEKRNIGINFFANFVIGGCFSNNSLVIEQELIKLGKDEKVVFTQIESLENFQYNLFGQGTYKKFIEKCTAIINLSISEEDILSNMKQKGRYNIKVAEKHGVLVNKVANNLKNLDLFYGLLSETKDRDNFSVNSKSYFGTFLNFLYSNNIGGLYFATKDDELIAAGIFVFYNNTAYYYYGASTTDNNKRKFMATYLLQWRLIQEAKILGLNNYDFLGINCPGCDSKKLAGVTDFKLKLTSEIKIWPDSAIYVHQNIQYFALKSIKFFKKIVGKQ